MNFKPNNYIIATLTFAITLFFGNITPDNSQVSAQCGKKSYSLVDQHGTLVGTVHVSNSQTNVILTYDLLNESHVIESASADISSNFNTSQLQDFQLKIIDSNYTIDSNKTTSQSMLNTENKILLPYGIYNLKTGDDYLLYTKIFIKNEDGIITSASISNDADQRDINPHIVINCIEEVSSSIINVRRTSRP